jgi:hypothetical protein
MEIKTIKIESDYEEASKSLEKSFTLNSKPK